MVLLKQNGISVDALSPSNADAWVVPEGGTAGVYVSDPGRKAELIPELRKIFSGGEGVAKVYGTEDFDEIGYPVPTKAGMAGSRPTAIRLTYDPNEGRRWRMGKPVKISMR